MTTQNANTDEVKTETEVTLELWQFSPAPQFVQGMVTTRRYDNGSMVAGLAIPKRKEIAATLNLRGKDNAPALTAQLLVLTDRIKEAGIAEFAKMAASQDWTGKRFAIRQGKNGNKTATMVLQSVKRSAEVTVDQMSASLAKMTPEQRKACLDRLLAAAAPAGEIVDQPAPEQLPPAGPEAPQPEPQPMTEEEQARQAHIEEMKAKGLTDADIALELEYEAEIRAEAAARGETLTQEQVEAAK